MNSDGIQRQVFEILDNRMGDSVPCEFCGSPMSVEVMHGENRTGAKGYYMAFFCTCAEWQFVETEINIVHLNDTGCRD